MSSIVQPYPADTPWRFRPRLHGAGELICQLAFVWEASYSSMSDDYLPEEISARDLYLKWAGRRQNHLAADHPGRYVAGEVSISWFITSPDRPDRVFEGAPFQQHVPGLEGLEDFRTHFTPPVHAVSGEPLNWLRLPVEDLGWNEHRRDKGGFVQEALGWKPAPLQHTMNVAQLAAAAGLV
ncbi:hypothetical protein ACIGZJ_34355 [Kitasatospora sp. NPDC052868]|uniref:hypothetical protein n=1 Tax=Kitasatospora sp. NPDC052868 TaxID=3364060 RepID=UPI0037CA64EB